MCHRTLDMVFGKLNFLLSNSLCPTKNNLEDPIYYVIGSILLSSYVLISTAIKYYFLIRATQKKTVLLIFSSSSKRDKENSSIMLVESSSSMKLRFSMNIYIYNILCNLYIIFCTFPQ